MAKRKRLGPAALVGTGDESVSAGGLGPIGSPPIAQVAGAAAQDAAAREMADELTAARVEGRMAQDIPLSDIDEAHLSRDRIAVSAVDLAALQASIAARGQQMPIEVVDLGGDATPRYGLISGWRRLAALKALHAEGEGGAFSTVRAVLRRPETAAEAYLSMVEENELRVGLSYYERAQVAARATDLGVFESTADAIRSLFPTASKAKRSKINSFARVFRVLDPVLSFPEQLPERLGLRVAKALDEGQGGALYQGMGQGGPFGDPAAEQARLDLLLSPKKGSDTPVRVDPVTYPGGVTLTRSKGAVKVSGAGVDDGLWRDLTAWLEARQNGST